MSLDFEGIGDLADIFGATLDLTPKGKKVECGARPPKPKPTRHVEWNNTTSFKFNGYLARVTHVTCEGCGQVNKLLVGVFTEEIHLPTGTRRLTLLARGAQWPQGETHRREVDYRFVPYCGGCIGELGFGEEIER